MYPIIKSYVNGIKTKSELCEENDLSKHVFQYWLGKYNRSIRSNVEGTDFVPIHIDTTAVQQSIFIKLGNGTEIKIPMS